MKVNRAAVLFLAGAASARAEEQSSLALFEQRDDGGGEKTGEIHRLLRKKGSKVKETGEGGRVKGGAKSPKKKRSPGGVGGRVGGPMSRAFVCDFCASPTPVTGNNDNCVRSCDCPSGCCARLTSPGGYGRPVWGDKNDYWCISREHADWANWCCIQEYPQDVPTEGLP